MHARGILHRDVSAGNVLRVGSQFKLNDFDISTQCSSSPDELKRRCGTPAFISPQWAPDTAYCEAYDRHALGLTMAALLELSGTKEEQLAELLQSDMVPDTFKDFLKK